MRTPPTTGPLSGLDLITACADAVRQRDAAKTRVEELNKELAAAINRSQTLTNAVQAMKGAVEGKGTYDAATGEVAYPETPAKQA